MEERILAERARLSSELLRGMQALAELKIEQDRLVVRHQQLTIALANIEGAIAVLDKLTST